MAQIKTDKELMLQKVIGQNLKTARQVVARMSLQHVMQEVWGISDRKNRISEIETGSRMPSPYILVRLSMLYGVSLDFICGLSSDIERDLECARAGQITQGLRELAIDTVDRIGMSLASQVAKMPRMESVLLKENTLELLYFLRTNVRLEGILPADEYAEYYELLDVVHASCLQMENAIAKHSRIMELTIFEHIERTDQKIVAEYMTDHSSNLDQPVTAVLFDDTEKADESV